ESKLHGRRYEGLEQIQRYLSGLSIPPSPATGKKSTSRKLLTKLSGAIDILRTTLGEKITYLITFSENMVGKREALHKKLYLAQKAPGILTSQKLALRETHLKFVSDFAIEAIDHSHAKELEMSKQDF